MNVEEKDKLVDIGIPGSLWCEAVMTLHTRAACKLLACSQQDGDKPGNKDFTVNNLKKFAKKMNPIWIAAQNNDPFADWCLYRIEQKMEEIGRLMSAEKAKLDGLFESIGSAKLMSAHAIKPVEIKLSFANPFLHQAANLIAQYDKLVCTALAADHIRFKGRDTKEARDAKNAYIYTPAKRIRNGIRLETQWGHAGQLRPRFGEYPEGGSGHGHPAQVVP